jgi:hypothetical protein
MNIVSVALEIEVDAAITAQGIDRLYERYGAEVCIYLNGDDERIYKIRIPIAETGRTVESLIESIAFELKELEKK